MKITLHVLFICFWLFGNLFSQTLNIHTNSGTDVYYLTEIDSITFSVPGSIPLNGLIASYPFNGSADDESGNGNDGTVMGATITEDRMGVPDRAYSFDGIDDYIVIDQFEIALPLTVALWFKSDVINDEWDTLFGWNDDVLELSNGVQIMANGDGKMMSRIGAYGNDLISESIVDGDSTWHFITISRDNENIIKMYIDGILEVSSEITSSIGANNVLYFGKSFRPDEYEENFNGAIDNILIYNRALTHEEIQNLYQSSY